MAVFLLHWPIGNYEYISLSVLKLYEINVYSEVPECNLIISL